MSSESITYWVTTIAGGLVLGLILGFPLAWLLSLPIQRFMPDRAQQMRVAAGALLLLIGGVLWSRAMFNFLIDAAIIGLGIGFLLEAGRRARTAARRIRRAQA